MTNGLEEGLLLHNFAVSMHFGKTLSKVTFAFLSYELSSRSILTQQKRTKGVSPEDMGRSAPTSSISATTLKTRKMPRGRLKPNLAYARAIS